VPLLALLLLVAAGHDPAVLPHPQAAHVRRRQARFHGARAVGQRRERRFARARAGGRQLDVQRLALAGGAAAIESLSLAAAGERQHVTLQLAAVARQPARARIAATLAGPLRDLLDLDGAVLDPAGHVEPLYRLELRLPAAHVRAAVAGNEGQGRDVEAADRPARLREVPLLLLDPRVTGAHPLVDRRAVHAVPDAGDFEAPLRRSGQCRMPSRAAGGGGGRQGADPKANETHPVPPGLKKKVLV
jgi:hypothetical protein